MPGVTAPILEKALDGERITDAEALTLLESKDLVSIGKVADDLRARRTDAGRITYIIDRNVNYTNVCVTDCDFCAFYRRPGRPREGYLLPKTVIYKKIEETIAIGGTGSSCRAVTIPTSAIDYYEDLFRSLKERYPIHLHALSPPEIQHIARRSKLTVPATLDAAARRGARLDPGRRRRDPRRPRARDHRAEEDEDRGLARRHAPRAPARHVDDRDDDVRPRRDARRAHRAHAPHPRAAGRDARLPRLHLVDVPAGRHAARRRSSTHHPTSFEYLRTQAVSPHRPRQRRPHPVARGSRRA